jgi:hypothetical protein
MAFYDIALTYAKAGDFGQALETAKMMEDAVLKSEVLVEISGDVARLSEEDTTILLELRFSRLNIHLGELGVLAVNPQVSREVHGLFFRPTTRVVAP